METVSPRVLVVDDDAGLAAMIRMALQRAGYQVITAGDGRAGLSLLMHEGPFEILITDLVMPGASGLELLRRGLEMDPELVVILMTAAGTMQSAIEALRQGAYDYLLKPFESMQAFMVTVDRAAEHRRLRLERQALTARLEEQAGRFQALVEATGDAILSADQEGILNLVNPAAARLLSPGGEPAENWLGRPADEVLPGPLKALISGWQAAGKALPSTAEIAWPADRIHLASLTPIWGGKGGWFLTLRDITHLRRLDQFKAQVLRDSVSRLRLPLAQAMSGLVELNQAVGADPQLTPLVFRLMGTWEGIKKWSEDLAEIAQLYAAEDLDLVSLDLRPVFDDLVARLQQGQAQDRNLRLQMNLPEQLPSVKADPNQVRRLLQVLLDRAVERSARGGEVRLAARVHEAQVWIDVADDGPASDEVDIPFLFERSTSIRKGRTGPLDRGVELEMVRTIMNRMQGQIWVGGNSPRGSTITICLPLVRPPAFY